MRQAIVRSASVGCIQLPNRSFREPPLGDTRAGQSAIAGRTDLTTPVGSYLIGAVAQLTPGGRPGRHPQSGTYPTDKRVGRGRLGVCAT